MVIIIYKRLDNNRRKKMLDYMSYNIMNSDAAKEKILQILNRGNYD